MKKTLVYLVIGMLVFATGSAFAGLNYPDIDVSGKISVKVIDVANLDDYKDDAGTNTNTIQTKVSLKLSSELADNVALAVLLEKPIRSSGIVADTISSLESGIEVTRANLKMAGIADKVDLTVGRQEVGERFDSLVAYYYAADGIVAKTTCGPVNLMLAMAKTGTGDKDNLSILKASGEIAGVAVAGSLYNLDPEKSVNKRVLDLALSGKVDAGCGINYAVEYAKQEDHATPTKLKANASLARVNYGGCDTPVGNLKCGVIYLKTSGGADKTYNGIAPSLKVTEIASDIRAGKNVNDDDAIYAPDISNLKGIILNASLAVNDALTLGLACGMYDETKVVSGSSDIGKEINLSANYKQSENISLNLLFAQASPGDNLQKDADAVTKIQAGMKISFK